MSSIEQFDTPQLAAARAKAWNQEGDRILTAEAAQSWIEARGLVLFAPRPQQLPSPSPSLVEATLGTANAAPTLAETDTARSLVARLTAEGAVLPLNLLGVPGDTPDFIVSAQVFSFVFTLRGDKAWKQPPATSGAVKVSTLGLRVYETLGTHGSLTAAELASELGREVTEAAILRVLAELWSQLRVLPLADQGGGATRWELTTKRFTKTIKAGANAGLPTALSALISLYLAQAVAATEDEVATFLSPLTARSRVKEVLHALLGARQLDTIAVEGKTLVYLPGTLPAVTAAEGEGVEQAAPLPKPKKIGTGRPKAPADDTGEGKIRSFKSERSTAGDFRGKPARSSAPARGGAARPGSFARPAGKFAPRGEGRPDRERRAFQRSDASKPSFDRPWKEDRGPRPSGGDKAPASFAKYRKPEGEDRKPLGRREQAGLPDEKRTPSARSYRPREGASTGGFAAKRPYTPRAGQDAGRGARPDSRQGAGNFAKRPYKPREAGEGGDARPPRSFKPRSGASAGFTKKPYTPRGEGGGFVAKRPFTPRAGGSAGDAPRPYRSRESGEGAAPKRPYKPREGAPAYDRSAPRKTFGAKPAFGSKPPFAKSGFKKAGFSKPGFSKQGFSKAGSSESSARFGAKRPSGSSARRPVSDAPSGWVKPARRKDKPATEE